MEKATLGLVMSAALLCGFLHPLWPDAPVSLERLHIFWFNLMSGGALILYFTEGAGAVSRKVKIYYLLAFLYALSAAARIYPVTLILSAAVLALVESVRLGRFSFFPFDFFRRDVPVSDKFNHASLLCLSSGLVISSLVILNNEYLHLIVGYKKLTLDVFFLGFSFPISLIVMSIMFSFMTAPAGRFAGVLKEASFWFVNLGVIVFFLFIILEMLVAEIVVASVLTVTVTVIFGLFLKTARRVQQKLFLASGMTFLLFTALTGLFYLLKYFYPPLEPYKAYLLTMHAMVSLYGWNLSGLFIISRWHDFPIRLNSGLIIFLHWAVCFVLAPLGKHFLGFGLTAMPVYVFLLWTVLFGTSAEATSSRGRPKDPSPAR